MIPLWPWLTLPSSATITMAMATTITTKKTKTTDELAAAASPLEKDAEDIADLVVSLTRDLLLRRVVEVDVNNFSVDREE